MQNQENGKRKKNCRLFEKPVIKRGIENITRLDIANANYTLTITEATKENRQLFSAYKCCNNISV